MDPSLRLLTGNASENAVKEMLYILAFSIIHSFNTVLLVIFFNYVRHSLWSTSRSRSLAITDINWVWFAICWNYNDMP